MTPRLFVRVLLHGVLALLVLGAGPSEARSARPQLVDEILSLPDGPFAIGHRGFGENLGEDPSRPIENTVRAVRRAFKAGISVIEVDVQLTRDHRVVAYHDDFLPDSTCLNRLTFGELRRRLPHVPSLHEVLNEVKQFTQSSGPLQGVVIIELKAAAPMCDPHDRQDPAIAFSVTTAIRLMGMTRQATLTSFSPSLLYLASVGAPELTRILAVSGLQFLTEAEVEAMLGLPVTLIDKRLDLGLQWAEIGPIFRLPGYQSLADVLSTAAKEGLAWSRPTCSC